MSNLQQRIADLMRDTGATHADLVAVTGKSSSAISQIISGPTKSLLASTAGALERKYGFRAEWLATGKGPKKVASPAAGSAGHSINEPDANYPASGALAYTHWRAVADEVARQLGATRSKVDARQFMQLVDLLSDAIPAEAPDAQRTQVVGQHLRLVG